MGRFLYVPRPMRRQDFHYELPEELIAQQPADRRDGSRLMVVPHTGQPSVGPFNQIADAFRGDEILVLNDTRVVPARIGGQKETGGRIEFFFLESLDNGRVKAMLRGKRLKPGGHLVLPDARGVILEHDGVFEIQLEGVTDVWAWLQNVGQIPLPPYIRRDPNPADRERYQTVFAEKPGAVAAPTAGLHLTEDILTTLRGKGVQVCTVTLHVGLGTFMPMRVDRVADHQMHWERYEVPIATQDALASERPVVAVGTTVVRALESYARPPQADRTDIFIYPGFEFAQVDGLITNFHLPESTLLMMVSAFAGPTRIMDAYRAAVDAKMCFFSYGHAILLRREHGRWT